MSRALFLSIAWLLCDPAPACGDESQSETAVAKLRALIAEEPKDARSHHFLGLLLSEAGDIPGADQAFGMAVSLTKPKTQHHLHAAAKLMTALMHERKGDEAAAEAEYRTWLHDPIAAAQACESLISLLLKQHRRGERPQGASEAVEAARVALETVLAAPPVAAGTAAGALHEAYLPLRADSILAREATVREFLGAALSFDGDLQGAKEESVKALALWRADGAASPDGRLFLSEGVSTLTHLAHSVETTRLLAVAAASCSKVGAHAEAESLLREGPNLLKVADAQQAPPSVLHAAVAARVTLAKHLRDRVAASKKAEARTFLQEALSLKPDDSHALAELEALGADGGEAPPGAARNFTLLGSVRFWAAIVLCLASGAYILS